MCVCVRVHCVHASFPLSPFPDDRRNSSSSSSSSVLASRNTSMSRFILFLYTRASPLSTPSGKLFLFHPTLPHARQMNSSVTPPFCLPAFLVRANDYSWCFCTSFLLGSDSPSWNKHKPENITTNEGEHPPSDFYDYCLFPVVCFTSLTACHSLGGAKPFFAPHSNTHTHTLKQNLFQHGCPEWQRVRTTQNANTSERASCATRYLTHACARECID